MCRFFCCGVDVDTRDDATDDDDGDLFSKPANGNDERNRARIFCIVKEK
jgi:hypothetical protein